MRIFTLCFIVTLVLRSGAGAQSNEASALAFARDIAVRALTFTQRDRQALPRLQSSFTDEGWKQFLATLDTWLDSSGAPTFGSSFVPSGEGRMVDELDGVRHMRIPGTLTQTQNQSRTTYRVFAADVWVVGDPPRVSRLTSTTCAGGSTGCQ